MIDTASGAKLILQLPPTASKGTVIDIAVTSDRVAIVGADHSIAVFEVPLEWETDDPDCQIVTHISPSPMTGDDSNDKESRVQHSIGPVNKVEWVRKDGEEWLAIGGSEGVIIISPNAHRGLAELHVAEVVALHKVLQTEGVSVPQLQKARKADAVRSGCCLVQPE